MQFETGKSLATLTTFGIGGPAKFFTEADTLEKLQAAIAFAEANSLRYFVLGKGSNTLFSDQGFDGLVILNKIHFCEEKEGEFHVGAGYSFSLLGSQTARKGFTGLEFASGIPGSVGGAIYMNAGANGQETFETLTEVSFVNHLGAVEVVHEFSYGYRTSCFQHKKGAIASARFRLTPCKEARGKQLKIIDYRTKTQPLGDQSAGCLFRNVAKEVSAGALIEQAGLKGFRLGGAEVSPLHANFIVNRENATADDVLALADHIKKTVLEKTGHRLEMEIKVIGHDL
jgi:UDP-N-acetylmuramate dehydrogenase